MEKIVSKYLYYKRGHEFVVVGGVDFRRLPSDWPANMDTKAAPSTCFINVYIYYKDFKS